MFIPRLKGGSAEVNAVDGELEGFGVKLDASLARFAGGSVETVEGFAHVAGVKREKDFQGGTGKIQHSAESWSSNTNRAPATGC